jgi:hypothetical protein
MQLGREPALILPPAGGLPPTGLVDGEMPALTMQDVLLWAEEVGSK